MEDKLISLIIVSILLIFNYSFTIVYFSLKRKFQKTNTSCKFIVMNGKGGLIFFDALLSGLGIGCIYGNDLMLEVAILFWLSFVLWTLIKLSYYSPVIKVDKDQVKVLSFIKGISKFSLNDVLLVKNVIKRKTLHIYLCGKKGILLDIVNMDEHLYQIVKDLTTGKYNVLEVDIPESMLNTK